MKKTSNPYSLKNTLRKIKLHVAEINVANFNKDGFYRCSVMASLVKAFEFVSFSQKKQNEPYFQMASLRGICEDLIVLSFLRSFSDRDEIIDAIMNTHMAESLSVQTAFFSSARAWQPIIKSLPLHKENCVAKLNELAQAHGWKKGGTHQLPTVRKMAIESKLLELYDFFYSTSSKLVHFSPHVLMRMGWGKPEAGQKVSKDTDWSFSTKNFVDYYYDFNQV